jgi:hypothetical protein
VRIPRAPLPLALALAVLAGACGGRPLPGSPAPIPLDGYVPALVNRKCARAVACRQMPDMATCLSTASIDLSQFIDAVNAGKIIYDGAAAATCFAATSLVGVACTTTAQQAVPNDPSCAHIFNGTVAEGGPCTQPDECVSASCNLDLVTGCSGTPGCCTGACAPTAPAASAPLPVGADCSAAGSSCVAGAFCSASTALCVANVTVGQPCDNATEKFCGPGLTCLPAPGGTQQVCLAPPAEGETCATGLPCDGLDDFCDPATRTCQPEIGVGGACPNGVGCVDYAQCDGRTRTCVENGQVGDSCSLSDGSLCLGSLQCTTEGASSDGRCAVPPPPIICP